MCGASLSMLFMRLCTGTTQRQPVGSLESDAGLVTDILLAIGREELADNPATVDLLKDILRQTNGDTIRSAELIKDIMADNGSSPSTPQHPERMQEAVGLEMSGGNFQDAIYQVYSADNCMLQGTYHY